MRENVLKTKSYAFALRIFKLYKYLLTHKEYVLSKQLLKSGTAVGSLVSEVEFGQSRMDFVSKMSIALNEAMKHSIGSLFSRTLSTSTQRCRRE